MSEEWNWLSSDADLQFWHLLFPIKHTLKHVLQVKLTAKLEGQSIMLGKSNASTSCYVLNCSVAVSSLQSFSFWFHFVATPDYMLVKGGYRKEPPWPNKRPLLLVMESCHRQISFSSSSTWAKEITMIFFRSSLEWNLMKTTYNTQQHPKSTNTPPQNKPILNFCKWNIRLLLNILVS
jgi:hypothetical protein